MKIIFCGRKPSSVIALKHILSLGWEVLLVIIPNKNEPLWYPANSLRDYALSQRLTLSTLEDANNHIDRNFAIEYGFYLKNTDLLISYLFPQRITTPLLCLPKMGSINFHPSPLPKYAGVGGYNFAILNQAKSYGCTAHFMDENFDTGDIIKVMQFDIDPDIETAFSLERRTQTEMLSLFRSVIRMIYLGYDLPRQPQIYTEYITRQMFEKARRIEPKDDIETINRKIRAFWYPPYPGASLKIKGQEYSIIHIDQLPTLFSDYSASQSILGAPLEVE